MKTYPFIFLLITLLSINIATGKTPYQKRLQNLIAQKGSLTSSEASQLLFHYLTDSIFPEWYGTPWDFNGYSNIPGEGEIACGYFVSTTLKHAGFNLNRYKLAQQASANIVKAICGNENVKWSKNKYSLINGIKTKSNTLYVLGLDYHVGFLSVEKDKVYFIHSDYFNNKVTKELALQSDAFNATERYVIAEVTNNTTLMKKWKTNEKVF